ISKGAGHVRSGRRCSAPFVSRVLPAHADVRHGRAATRSSPMAKTIKTYNPATDNVLEEHELSAPAAVEQALARSAAAFAEWRRTPLEQRARLLGAVAKRLRESEEALARHATLEMGKPLAQAKAEVQK